jgi:hypothetical protein
MLPSILEANFMDESYLTPLKKQNLEYLLSLADFFDINPKKEAYLFWILRLFDTIPLPPNWSKNTTPTIPTSITYTDSETHLSLPYHPSVPFIFFFLRKMRTYYKMHLEEVRHTDLFKITGEGEGKVVTGYEGFKKGVIQYTKEVIRSKRGIDCLGRGRKVMRDRMIMGMVRN